MSLANIIERVRGGEPPEVARLDSIEKKTPFQERLLSSMGSMYEKGIRKMAGIEDEGLPEGYSASKGFNEDVSRMVSEPFIQMYKRGKEKSEMPLKESAIANIKDTGEVLKYMAKSAGRLATSTVDMGQMAFRNKIDPIEWEKIPVLKNIPSYQRQAELKASSGMEMKQIIAEAVRDVALDTLTVYGTAKTLQSAEKVLGGGSKIKPTKYIQKEMAPQTRMKVINDAVKSGDIPKSKIIVQGKKTLARPDVVKGRLDDYAGVLDREVGKGAGDMLRSRIDINNVHYRGGKFVEIHREAQKLLKDTIETKIVESGTMARLAPRTKYSPYHGESFKKMTAPEFMSEYVKGKSVNDAVRAEASREYLKYVESLFEQGQATAKEVSMAKKMIKINE